MSKKFTSTLRVKDLTTNQVFDIHAAWDTESFVTMDGVKVKVHPTVIRLMVRRGSKFDGSTLLGPRRMQLL